MEYQFILERYSGKKSRHTCPNCEKKAQFSRYVDLNTNTHIADDVGKCNREAKCGFHKTPSQFYKDSSTPTHKIKTLSNIRVKPKQEEGKASIIPIKYVALSRKKADQTPFYRYFSEVLSNDSLDRAFKLYQVGRYHYHNWTNCVIFWQIDLKNNVRTGKIFKYNPSTGKRIAQNWFHSIHYKDKFQLKQIPFGLHLINEDSTKKIAIVESEKTALLMSIALPSFIWLAVGGCQNLNHSMLSDIQNRDIVLIPDAGKYELWKEKIKRLPQSNFYEVSDLFHEHASDFEKEEDYDIADYYLREIKSARSSGFI
jgi:hypothetical protein